MRPTPWLLTGAVAVLVAGAASVYLLVDLTQQATRNTLGLGLAAGSVTTSAAFVLTYLLQAVINTNNLRTTLLMKRDLSLFDFHGVNLARISLRGRTLVGANLSAANLVGADLRGCDLRAALLTGSNLSKADLRGTDLRGADVRNCRLREARLWDAKISGADFRGARMRGAALIAVQGQPLQDSEIDDIYAAGGQVKGVYSAERVKDGDDYRSPCSRGPTFPTRTSPQRTSRRRIYRALTSRTPDCRRRGNRWRNPGPATPSGTSCRTSSDQRFKVQPTSVTVGRI